MERNFVPEAWVGERVMVVRFDERGASLPEQRGRLIGVREEGVLFAEESWPDPPDEAMLEEDKLYPWSTLALITLLREL